MSGTQEINRMLINHLEKLMIISRDYLGKPSKALATQYKWFMDRVDEMYELGWIDLETYNKAMMGIEYLIRLNKENKSGKKKD